MRKSTHPCGLVAVAAALVILAPHAATAAETMTGCLEKKVGGFALYASGKRLAVAGDNIDFEKHAGHTVKLTGEESGGESFRVTSLEHVAPTCDNSTDSDSPTAADNRLTAADQGTSEADIEMTAKIRRAIVDDENLSTLAHNVTIITRDGKVTLRGDVRSRQEKAALASKAQTAAGASVDNQLTVKSDSKQSTTKERRKDNGK